MVTFQEDTKADQATAPLPTSTSSFGRLRASMRQSITSMLPMSFDDQVDRCKCAPKTDRKSMKHARMSQVGELIDLDFSDEFIPDGPKNSDEAKQLQQENNFFGFKWGGNQSQQLKAPEEKKEEPTKTEEKPARRDSTSSKHSTSSAASNISQRWGNFWNNLTNQQPPPPPKSTKIESALGKLDRQEEDDSSVNPDDSEPDLFK